MRLQPYGLGLGKADEAFGGAKGDDAADGGGKPEAGHLVMKERGGATQLGDLASESAKLIE